MYVQVHEIMYSHTGIQGVMLDFCLGEHNFSKPYQTIEHLYLFIHASGGGVRPGLLLQSAFSTDFLGEFFGGGTGRKYYVPTPLYETLTYVCFEKDHNNHGIISVLALPDLITLHKSVNVHVLYAYIH